MDKKTIKLLILEDNPDDAELAIKELEHEGFSIEWSRVDTEEGFRKALAEKPDLILADYRLPSFDARVALQIQQQITSEIPLIIVSGTIGEEVAVECMKSGATDYVLKDRLFRLGPVVKRALEEAETCRERKRAEEALVQSEAKYRMLVEQLPVITYIAALDETSTTLYISPQIEKILDISTAEYKADPDFWVKHLHPEDRERVMGEVSRCHETGQPFVSEYRMVSKDGRLTWLSDNAVIVRDDKGNQLCLQGVMYDITERKQAEEEKRNLEAQLQRAQKTEAIGTLAGGIAHDFNNLLAVIIGYTELAMGGVPADSLTYSNLDEVLKAGLRAKDLVQQILTFTRGGEEERGPVQIDLIVKEALKLLRSSLPTTIEIRRDIASANMVFGDATQIHQVLMNLCANASHAMNDKGGVLEVRLRNADFGVRSVELGEDKEHSTFRNPKSEIEPEPGSYVDLSVRDTGCGIAPENLDKIFDPYFTTREIGRGTGLGLAVVHGIVRKFAGTITVESEVGKGTTIHVYLPAIKRQVAKEPKEIEPLPTGDERILFVDDEQAMADMGKQMLGVLGYDVVSRTSSVEALELFRVKHDRFDVVITDMTMPNMTGDKLAKEMIKIRPDIPIILCTGYSERISEEKAMAMGIRGFAMKPLVMLNLAKIIRKVL